MIVPHYSSLQYLPPHPRLQLSPETLPLSPPFLFPLSFRHSTLLSRAKSIPSTHPHSFTLFCTEQWKCHFDYSISTFKMCVRELTCVPLSPPTSLPPFYSPLPRPLPPPLRVHIYTARFYPSFDYQFGLLILPLSFFGKAKTFFKNASGENHASHSLPAPCSLPPTHLLV